MMAAGGTVHTNADMAGVLTACILGILVSLIFLVLGWIDKRRTPVAQDAAVDDEETFEPTLTATRNWQEMHNTGGLPAMNPPYQSRAGSALVSLGSAPLSSPASPVPAEVRRHSPRRPNLFVALVGGTLGGLSLLIRPQPAPGGRHRPRVVAPEVVPVAVPEFVVASAPVPASSLASPAEPVVDLPAEVVEVPDFDWIEGWQREMHDKAAGLDSTGVIPACRDDERVSA